MNGGWRRAPVLGIALGLLLLALGTEAAGAAPSATQPARPKRRPAAVEPARTLNPRPSARATPVSQKRDLPAPSDASAPRAARGFLIYLMDGDEPIVVSRFVEDDGQILFQKYGGWVRIPTYEILKIVRDEPDRTVNLPPPSPVMSGTAGAPLLPEPDLYLTMRGGGNLKVSRLTPEGDLIRVSVLNGSFTVPRSEIFGVVRVPRGSDIPEAWLSIRSTDTTDGSAPAQSAGLLPATPDPRLPYQKSDQPHLLRLANGQLMRIEGFWVEDGEFRFRRLGGMVGVALSEILRLIPEEIAPVRGRTPVRFARRRGPDLLEVRVRSGYHGVRLVGVEPLEGTWTGENPWRSLEHGTIIYLEFDRQRYDAEGNWLAYVFLPNGRMLNAELIRLGLARPLGDGRNVRYLDLFHELAAPDPTAATDEEPPAAD